MENEKGKLYYGTGLDNSQLRTDAAESKNLLRGIGNTAVSEGDKIDAAMKKIGASVAGVFAVSKVKEFVSQVAHVRGEFQQIEIAFKTMLGSADKANALMQQLIKTAATTPFNMSDVAQGAKQLLAYGVQADKVNETLIRLGDIAAGLSIPLNDLAYLYGTTMVQGRLYTQDLNQFLGRGIPLTDELAKQFGVAKDKVKDLVTEGKVGFPEVEKAIIAMTSEGGKFGGLMEAQSHTITGQLSNLEDGFEQMFNEIGKSTEGIISDTISVAATVVENWRTVGDVLLGVIATYGAYKAAVISTAAVQGAIKTVKHSEEAAQLYEVMTAEQQAKISKMNLSKTSEEYYLAVKAEIQAEMERQTQLAVTTQAELTAARERLATAESEKAAAAEKVASKRAELEAVLQEAATEQTAAVQKKIAIESEAQSRAALRAQKLQEQKDTAISQARALKEAQASQEVIAAKNREIATINQKLVAAKAEEVQHSRNIVALRKEMAATVDATTSKKVAQATTALETAEENLSTAAKTRNTAAREVSSKAALLDSTVRRANTVETAANTAAQTANATATGFLSAAKTKLTAVASRLNAVIMANPWALALAAVVALGYGIYKLITYQTDEQKAQQKLDDATKEYNKTVAAEQVQIDSMFARLKTAKKGTEEYNNAKQAIISQYGKYLEGLQSEVKNLNNVEAAYRAVSAAARDAAKARAMEAFTKDAADTYATTESEQKEKLYQLLKDKFGDQKSKGGTSRVENVYWQLVRVMEGKSKLNENWVKQFDKTHYIAGDPMTGIGSYSYTTNDIRDILSKVSGAKSTYNKSMEEATRRFGDNPLDKKTETKPTEVVKNKKYWEDYQKEQQGLLDAMTAAELKTKKAATIRANIAKAQKNIDAYSVSKTTAAGNKAHTETVKIEDQTAERTDKIQEYKDAVIEANAEAELDIRQKQIENMQEGYEKQKAQINLNYDRLIYENKKREQSMKDALTDEKVLEYQNAHPKATKAQTLAYKASLNITVADLSKEQQDQLAAYQKIADETKVKGNKEALNTMLQDSLTYEQQRAKIAEDYQKKIENLYQHDENGNRLKDENGKDKFNDGVSQSNVDELNYQEEQALNAVDAQFAQREETYKAWCNEIANLTLEQLQALLTKAEEELKKAEQDNKNGNGSSQQLAVARAKVTTAKNNVAAAKAKTDLKPDKRSLKEWEDLYKTLNDVNKTFEEIGDTIGGVAGDIIKTAGQISTSTLSMINGIVQLVNNSSTGMTVTAATASKAIQTVEKASVILAIISAALQIATQIANLFNDDESKQEEIENLQQRIDQLQWELDNADIVRLQENNGKAIDLVKQKLEETRVEMLKDIETLSGFEKKWTTLALKVSSSDTLLKQSAEKIATAYANVAYTADKALGGQKYSEAREQLENIAQQQLLIQEQIETEKSKKDIDDDKIAEWEEKIEELGEQAVNVINEMVEDIMGGSSSDIAEQLSDAFFEAFQNGEDYAQAWHDEVTDLIADITKNLLVQKFLEEPLGEVFDKYKAQWFKDGKFMGIDTVLNSLSSLTSDLDTIGDNWITIWEALPQQIQDMITAASDSTRETSSSGIANASQDSVDELNGRATAIQGHTYSISENTKLLLSTANLILQSVLNIENNTDGLSDRVAGVESSVKEIKDTVNDIALKGIKIK